MEYCFIKRRSSSKAFTIIELLTVIAVVGILMGIAFGIYRGVNQRGQITRAEAETAALAQALEQYRTHYGDYPWIPGTTEEQRSERLYEALNGERGPTGMALNPKGRVFIEHERFRLADPGDPDASGNYLLDPWNNRYQYHYKRQTDDGAAWENPSFVLFSKGPSGNSKADDPPASGKPEYDHPENRDNIYANR